MALCVNFLSLPELLGKTGLYEMFIQSYVEVFNREWKENWTADQIKDKYAAFVRSDGEACRVCLVIDDQGEEERLAAFSVLFCGSVIETVGLRDLPPKLTEASQVASIQEALVRHLNLAQDEKVVFFREMVVLPQYRGGIASVQKITEAPLVWAKEQGLRFAWFWTARISNLYGIALGLDMKSVYRYNDHAGHTVFAYYIPDILAEAQAESRAVEKKIQLRISQLTAGD